MSVEPLPLDRATTRCTEQGFEGAPPVAADGKVEDGGEIKNPADQDAADARTAAARQFVSDDFVEGGWRGWLCVLGSFLIMLATFGYANTFGVFQSYYQLNFLSDKSASDISWIGSTGMAIEFCLAFLTGPLFDKGYFRAVLVFGCTLFTFSLFMVSLCTEYWQVFLAQAVSLGIGMGFLYIPSVSILNHYFYRRRALAMGIAIAGSSVGGIAFPQMLNHLFDRIGFAKAVRASAYLVLGLFVIANLVMKSRYPPRSETASIRKTQSGSLRKLFTDPLYICTTLAVTLLCLGVLYPITYIQVFAELAGLDAKISNNVLSILNSSSFMGRILLPAASDDLGPFNAFIISSGGCTILIFALYGATNAAGVVIFTVLFGFFAGGFISLISPLFISTAESIHEIGLRQGVGLIFNGLAILVCTPIAGALLEAAGGSDFKYANAFAGGICVLGTLVLLLARRVQVRKLGKWRV